MDCKEAIEFCRNEVNWIEEEIYNYPQNREYAVMQFNKIIDLLHQGEKYKKMWWAFYDKFDDECWSVPDAMSEIREKYFPEEEE